VARRSQAERSAATRHSLVEAAVDCIAGQGLVHATLAVIADRAGVTRGAVQHHFGARDELLLAVVDHFGRELFRSLGSHIPTSLTVPERIAQICDRYWTLFSGQHFLAVMQIWLGTQDNAAIHRRMLDRIHWFEIEIDRQWAEIFSDSDLAQERIAAARHVALATMRGLAFRVSYTKDRERSSPEIALLVGMLVGALGR
jgi:AcrR family transcriptional regulator